jgi:hypothetical protein
MKVEGQARVSPVNYKARAFDPPSRHSINARNASIPSPPSFHSPPSTLIPTRALREDFGAKDFPTLQEVLPKSLPAAAQHPIQQRDHSFKPGDCAPDPYEQSR